MLPIPGTITDPRVTQRLDDPRVARLDRAIAAKRKELEALLAQRRAAALR